MIRNEPSLNSTLLLFLSHCRFEGLTTNGLEYSFTEDQVAFIPGHPDESAVNEGLRFEGWITVSNSTVLCQTVFLDYVLDEKTISIEEATITSVVKWFSSANWDLPEDLQDD